MANLQSYTFNAVLSCLALNSQTGDINIKEAGRRWLLRSVTFDLMITDGGTNNQIPWFLATQQRWLLWNWVGVPNVSGFLEYSGAWGTVYNGEKFKIFSPGQYIYNQLYYSDEQLMRFYAFNYDAVNPVNFSCQFIFEIEFIE